MIDSTRELTSCDVLVLGGGLSGLTVASALGHRAIVLERDDRPGGLVRTECFDGYWFDRVVHLLYFPDRVTEARVMRFMADVLVPCPPEAWVETTSGPTRFPFQMHLGGLPSTTAARCLDDLAQTLSSPNPYPQADTFEVALASAFGGTMCDIFMAPYNRKMWRRPLSELAASGFTWNIAKPDFGAALRGALTSSEDHRTYNADGFFPRPARTALQRGMEVLSLRMAAQVRNLHLRHEVTSIDLTQQVVTATHAGRQVKFHYRVACATTLPLPVVLAVCAQTPPRLQEACVRLRRNRVVAVGLRLRGTRPQRRGHWRYYADESVIFHRLVYMCEFDPYMAPADGWSVLAEVSERGEDPPTDPEEIIRTVVADARRVGAVPENCELLGTHHWVIDPAYVVFGPETQPLVAEATGFLRLHRVEPLGRYGRWEYSSMGQALQAAYEWADRILNNETAS